MKKYVTEKSEDYSLVDNHTGEILDLNITRKITLDEFIMVFFSSCPDMMCLTGTLLKVLICCWKYSTYNPTNEESGNILYNNLGFKESCRKDGLNASNAVIDNAISALCKKHFLLKKYRGEYLLNPQYFFNGRLSSRSNVNVHFHVEGEKEKEDVVTSDTP